MNDRTLNRSHSLRTNYANSYNGRQRASWRLTRRQRDWLADGARQTCGIRRGGRGKLTLDALRDRVWIDKGKHGQFAKAEKMHYEINLNNSLPTYTAVVKSRIRPKDLAEFVPAACGQVWSFIRSAGLPRPGRNFALYLDTGAVEVGVQVSQAFVGSDRIQCSQLPAGRVASTTHYGPYSQLSDAHSAIREWCAEHDHRLSNFSWELYGHWRESWNADPSKICTDVFYLLHEEKG